MELRAAEAAFSHKLTQWMILTSMASLGGAADFAISGRLGFARLGEVAICAYFVRSH